MTEVWINRRKSRNCCKMFTSFSDFYTLMNCYVWMKEKIRGSMCVIMLNFLDCFLQEEIFSVLVQSLRSVRNQTLNDAAFRHSFTETAVKTGALKLLSNFWNSLYQGKLYARIPVSYGRNYYMISDSKWWHKGNTVNVMSAIHLARIQFLLLFQSSYCCSFSFLYVLLLPERRVMKEAIVNSPLMDMFFVLLSTYQNQ